MLVPPHHIVCGEQAFSLSLKWWSIQHWHFLMTFHTPLSEWTSIYLMYCFGRHGTSAHTLAFLPNVFRHDFIQHIEVAVLTNNDNRDCFWENMSCLHLLLSFRSDILKAVFSCTIIILSVRTFHYKCFWFFLCKVSASGILQGHKSLLPRKIFQEIGVQSLLIQFLVPPKGEIFFGHPLHFHAFLLLLPHCT